MNKVSKYYRLNWDNGGYVIIKRYGSAKILKSIPKFTTGFAKYKDDKNTVFGYHVYGSTRGTESAGRHLFYTNVHDIQEMTKEQISKDYFVELI